ncbi:MAG: hypothetical protein HRU38_03000 [Saccharospirillaceae bacterium]|nr:hypothetical protein [Colwellia sp.]NRB77630.1 hypothetical protein [Saccharospirillaceae bacterium]
MKIDKNKLNTLLRSGLNPEIKTRKHLAAHLGLDPTSLTRWFANRDRLGNPRYPVVPDRHVTKILDLFGLSPQSLSLDEEEFRHHCFELSLQVKQGQNDVRQQNVALRQLSIEEYSTPNRKLFPLLLLIVLITSVIAWYFISGKSYLFEQSASSTFKSNVTKTKCWAGFSSSLGDFNQEDEADPCHYGKLFHQAMSQLKAENKKQSSVEFTAAQNYLLFLSKQLDKRRVNDKISLNLELGKSELRQLNYLSAQNHFDIALHILTSSTDPDPKILAEIVTLNAQIKAALK